MKTYPIAHPPLQSSSASLPWPLSTAALLRNPTDITNLSNWLADAGYSGLSKRLEAATPPRLRPAAISRALATLAPETCVLHAKEWARKSTGWHLFTEGWNNLKPFISHDELQPKGWGPLEAWQEAEICWCELVERITLYLPKIRQSLARLTLSQQANKSWSNPVICEFCWRVAPDFLINAVALDVRSTLSLLVTMVRAND